MQVCSGVRSNGNWALATSTSTCTVFLVWEPSSCSSGKYCYIYILLWKHKITNKYLENNLGLSCAKLSSILATFLYQSAKPIQAPDMSKIGWRLKVIQLSWAEKEWMDWGGFKTIKPYWYFSWKKVLQQHIHVLHQHILMLQHYIWVTMRIKLTQPSWSWDLGWAWQQCNQTTLAWAEMLWSQTNVSVSNFIS